MATMTSADGTAIGVRSHGRGPGIRGHSRQHPVRPTTTTARTLLIGGGRSPAYLGAAVAEPARIIPGATATTQPGLDHNAPDLNAPDTVAGLVRAFLAAADAAP